MKKSQLKQLIKEEILKVLKEDNSGALEDKIKSLRQPEDGDKFFTPSPNVELVAKKLGKILAIKGEYFFPGKKEVEIDSQENSINFLNMWKKYFKGDDIQTISSF